jgi:hypothetical protein
MIRNDPGAQEALKEKQWANHQFGPGKLGDVTRIYEINMIFLDCEQNSN